MELGTHLDEINGKCESNIKFCKSNEEFVFFINLYNH